MVGLEKFMKLHREICKMEIIDIDCLRLPQIYLYHKKIDDVLAWCEPTLKDFELITARNFFGNGNLHITEY